MTIGCIGQGFIGKNYADDFESRGYTVVRYAKEPAYEANKDAIATCDIVFIAVPTPSTPEGFDASIVESVIDLVGEGKTAVIKSTMQPGSTERIAAHFPTRFVMHSPEFLREKTAAHDAKHPERNIVGIPHDTPEWRAKATEVLAVLPPAPYTSIVDARSAELIKYIGNCFLTTKVVFFNAMYDLAQSLGVDWEQVREAVIHDPRIGASHTAVAHESGHGGVPGRGAGGHCFIKDLAALRELYERLRPADQEGIAFLAAIEEKNTRLLIESQKDLDLLGGVYGEAHVSARRDTNDTDTR